MRGAVETVSTSVTGEGRHSFSLPLPYDIIDLCKYISHGERKGGFIIAKALLPWQLRVILKGPPPFYMSSFFLQGVIYMPYTQI